MYFKSYEDYIKSDHWQKVRKKAWRQKEHRCEICGTSYNLILHHRKYETLGNEDIDKDLCILCRTCHRHVHFTLKGNRIELNYKSLYSRELRLKKLQNNIFYKIFTTPLGSVVNMIFS